MVGDAGVGELLPLIVGPYGVVVVLAIACWILWGKNNEREKKINELQEERVKGIVLDLKYRQDTLRDVMMAARETREILGKLNDLFESMVAQMENTDGDLAKNTAMVEEIRRGVTRLLDRQNRH